MKQPTVWRKSWFRLPWDGRRSVTRRVRWLVFLSAWKTCVLKQPVEAGLLNRWTDCGGQRLGWVHRLFSLGWEASSEGFCSRSPLAGCWSSSICQNQYSHHPPVLRIRIWRVWEDDKPTQANAQSRRVNRWRSCTACLWRVSHRDWNRRGGLCKSASTLFWCLHRQGVCRAFSQDG